MELRKRLGATVPKEIAYGGSNEDASLLLLRQNRAVMLDGASDSYAARAWVKCVMGGWRRAWRGTAFLDVAHRAYAQRVVKPTMWPQEAAYERGSYCTFLEAHFDLERRRLEVRAVGDTCAIGVRGDMEEDKVIQWGFPMDSSAQFTSVPVALSSDPSTIRKQHELLLAGSHSFSLAIGPIAHVVLATDAVAAWLLAEDQSIAFDRLRRLLGLSSPAGFRSMVLEERANKLMRVDDATVIVIDVVCGVP